MKRLILAIALTSWIPHISHSEVIGTTWYEMQHGGTVGRMAEFDEDGYLHFVWMNGLNYGATNRHIYYNFIDSTGLQQGWPGCGYPVEASNRAGYVTLDVGFGGRAFPAFHWTNVPAGDYSTAVATDFFPHTGTFITYEPPYPWVHGEEIEAGWPNIQIDVTGLIHVVASTTDIPGFVFRHGYTVGIYDLVTFTIFFRPQPYTWTDIGCSDVDAIDIAVSDISTRLAIAWINPHHDIMLFIDEDGRDLNFDEAFNLTQFGLGDTVFCHNDLSLLFDNQDILHIAFTTRGEYINASLIWHWSEQYPDEFSVIANAWDPSDLMDCGVGNVKAQRPSLAQQAGSGHLYCAYQVFDTDSLHLSAGGYPSGEVYMTYSDDGGFTWDMGTNITNTITQQGAAPGQCYSEICPTMARLVDEEYHVMYILDKDAGNVIQTEGTWTLNDVVYDHWWAHWWWESDGTDEPLEPCPFLNAELSSIHNPAEGESKVMHLSAAPNPFNLETIFTFELQEAGFVTLEVFDLNCRLVETLVEDFRNAGVHEVAFNASRLASGIYLYRLNAGGSAVQGKMVLIK